MTKEVLVAAVEKDFRSRTEAEKAVDAVFGGVEAVLRRGENVTIRGFGSFQAKDVSERMGRNPRTQLPIRIAAHRKLNFKSKMQF